MRIHTRELHPELTIKITGEEPWLARIYADFPVPKNETAPRVTGELTLRLEEAGTVVVRGDASFAPFVSCARCELPIKWPLEMNFNIRYSPDYSDDSNRDKSLTKAELDEYFLVENEVDLEELINDSIHLNLPTRLLAYADDEETCRVCMANLGDDLVYGSGEPVKAESPFAKLLKDPKATKIKH